MSTGKDNTGMRLDVKTPIDQLVLDPFAGRVKALPVGSAFSVQ